MDFKNGRLAARSRGRVFCLSDEKLVGQEPPIPEPELPFAASLVGLALAAEAHGGREPNGFASLSGTGGSNERLRQDRGAQGQCPARSEMPIHVTSQRRGLGLRASPTPIHEIFLRHTTAGEKTTGDVAGRWGLKGVTR